MAWPPKIATLAPHLRKDAKMRAVEAMEETLRLAKERGYDTVETKTLDTDYAHLMSMLERMKKGQKNGTFSEAKLSRWLGYAQGVLVANDVLSLNDLKKINKIYR